MSAVWVLCSTEHYALHLKHIRPTLCRESAKQASCNNLPPHAERTAEDEVKRPRSPVTVWVAQSTLRSTILHTSQHHVNLIIVCV